MEISNGVNFQFLLSCLYFFLPAYFTNMTPPVIKRAGLFNFLDRPVDLGKKIGNSPILGSHKSWRGVIFGLIVGISVVGLQYWLYQFCLFRFGWMKTCFFIKEISLIDYSKINLLLFGLLISGGAVFGDIISAFAKRRLKKEPGQRFIPFDQTNYVIGAFIFLQPWLKLNLTVWITIFALTFFLHIAVNWFGYLVGINKNKW